MVFIRGERGEGCNLMVAGLFSVVVREVSVSHHAIPQCDCEQHALKTTATCNQCGGRGGGDYALNTCYLPRQLLLLPFPVHGDQYSPCTCFLLPQGFM